MARGCDLQWSQVELATGRLHVRRAKNGSPSVHPMQGDEIRALRCLQREQGPSSHVFMTERDGPMTPKAFHALFGRIGGRAKMQFPIHPHMLRHGCGYALANAGHDTRRLQAYLGHKNIQHTVRYTELAPRGLKASGETDAIRWRSEACFRAEAPGRENSKLWRAIFVRYPCPNFANCRRSNWAIEAVDLALDGFTALLALHAARQGNA